MSLKSIRTLLGCDVGWREHDRLAARHAHAVSVMSYAMRTLIPDPRTRCRSGDLCDFQRIFGRFVWDSLMFWDFLPARARSAPRGSIWSVAGMEGAAPMSRCCRTG